MSKPFLAIISYYLRYFLFLGSRQPFSRRLPPRGIHAHVERRIEPKTHASCGIIQLGGRHPQIQQHTIHPLHTLLSQHLGQTGERRVHQGQTRIVQPPPGNNRSRIPIQRDQPSLRAQPLKDRPAVPTPTKRAIHIDTSGADRQAVHRFGQQNRYVKPIRRGHSVSPSMPAGSKSSPRAKISSCCFCQPASDHSSKWLP